MMDDPGQPSLPERAFDSLTDTRRAVVSLTEDVVDVSRHLGEAIEAAKRPKTYVKLVEDLTRASPLTMLAIAFIAGAMFASGARR